ncbi:PREDICTED: enolase-like protein ENO4 [Priapulus caudatus]|uniref:phosphopyruvate hydratase n=1 Tax=Priapulus caudatus TaxID=37621 RepID=A0ABM1ERH4_PRICU|nr:PREDICTED: enolase-like protein ENO4 [Priapulus caudatus]
MSQMQIHCQVKGIEQACGVSTMPCLDGEAAFTEAATCINDFISRSIVGLNAGDQTCVDLHIRTAHEEFLAEQVRLKDLALKASECSTDADVVQTKSSKSKTKASKSPKHSAKSKVGERPVEAPASLHAMLLASQAVAAAAAAAANVPLCTHLRHLSSMQDTCGYYRPAPVVSVLSGGGKGKLSLLRDVMVIPSSSFTLQQAVDVLMKLTLYLEATFGSKSGAVKNRWGVLMPSFDRIEQALDPLLEAFSQLQLEAGTDIFLGVALNVDSAYDQDKGKYDVAAGMQKSCEDMLAYYTDLRNKYPSIRLLVNPLAAQVTARLKQPLYKVIDAR